MTEEVKKFLFRYQMEIYIYYQIVNGLQNILIDKLLCDLASIEQKVTNKAGETLIIKKYQSQCRKLARLIPIALPTPKYVVCTSDLKQEVNERLKKLHPESNVKYFIKLCFVCLKLPVSQS